MNKGFVIKILLLVLLGVWTVGVYNFAFDRGYGQIPVPPEDLPEEADISLLWEVWEALEEKYAGELDYQQMIYGAAAGMVRSLEDPYTTFFTPEDSKIFQEDIAGTFEGVGMEIGIRDGELTVVSPLENTPAKEAGLLPGDKIIKIKDVATKGIRIEEAVKLIRGEKGTDVVLSIVREGWESPKDFTITRDTINIPNVRWELKEENIAHIIIHRFSGKLSSDFSKLAGEVLNSSAEKIVLDLRSNPGGLLHEAQNLAGWFIEKGKIVTIESFRGEEGKEYLAIGNEAFVGYSTVVLVNQGTASGAEILAAALRDNREEVKIVGEQTFGKGSVQEPANLRRGALLKITIANWLTPKGELIEGQGIEPDIEVKMTEEDYLEGRDPQLDKAVEILKQGL